MKGLQLLLLDKFMDGGKRNKFTVKEIQEHVKTTNQSTRQQFDGLIAEGWIEITGEEKHPSYYRVSDLGLKIYKGIRNVQRKPVVIIK